MFFEVGPANNAARSLRISSRPTVTSTVPTVICMGLRCVSGSSSVHIHQPAKSEEDRKQDHGDHDWAEAPGREHDARRDAGDGEQRAVGKIEHARHAVDQREPERDQRVQPSQQNAADQQLDNDGDHAREGGARTTARRRALRRSTQHAGR